MSKTARRMSDDHADCLQEQFEVCLCCMFMQFCHSFFLKRYTLTMGQQREFSSHQLAAGELLKPAALCIINECLFDDAWVTEDDNI